MQLRQHIGVSLCPRSVAEPWERRIPLPLDSRIISGELTDDHLVPRVAP
jgi:hypothetical protein